MGMKKQILKRTRVCRAEGNSPLKPVSSCVFVFMAQPVRRSACIRDQGYHPQTGRSLPEIISVLSQIPFFPLFVGSHHHI